MRFDILCSLGLVALSRASTLNPPVVPLIVRNPYLSTWLSSARVEPWEAWPIFWTGENIGFGVMASVPDSQTVFPLLGRPHDSLNSDQDYTIAYPEYLGTTFDASTTNLTFTVPNSAANSSATVVLSFLSPITPTSTLRQSLPAAYLSVHVEGTFGISIYLDINGQWVSGNRSNKIRWDLHDELLTPEGDSSQPRKTWRISRDHQELYTEFNDRGEWGTIHFSAPAGVNHQAGTSAALRQQFARHGHLKNATDHQFRGIMDSEPVFAFSKTFNLGANKGAVKKTEDSLLFSFALIQDPILQYAAARGLTHMRPYWASFFETADEMVAYHYGDFKTASSLALAYSQQLSRDAFASGSKEYEEIAALSARQVFGATEFSGTPDSPLLFLKEISSNGNCQTVDVIFPAFPFFLYTNPRWLAYLLEPLLEHQLSGQYPNDYSMHDLGYHFPNMTGHGDGRDEFMPLEECGNMLVMGLALINAYRYDAAPASNGLSVMEGTQKLNISEVQQRFVDTQGIDKTWSEMGTSGLKEAESWAERSYKLWQQWSVWLVKEALMPANQLSTDDFAGWLPYQTNLALKGIIGLRAMSDIAEMLDHKVDAKYYRDVAEEYIAKWQKLAISRDGTHAKLAYDWYGSWTTLYNLYADSLLCFHVRPSSNKTALNTMLENHSGQQRPLSNDDDVAASKEWQPFIPDEIYKIQSDWYSAVMQKYGLPLDSRARYTKSDWEFFAAAVASNKTRKVLLDSVALWVDQTSTNRPFTDLYETEGTGGFGCGLEFKARPVVGGHFAFLALERACGGRAMEGLRFLDLRFEEAVDVEKSLADDRDDGGWDEL
ncbi:glutaminase GtaA [Pyricularia oryzae 70-15]|uniref:Glutaminase GtaA n=3 Tax=Pyricularia oryzae TaxID=318829 RepID=G4N1P6_PYRO7|nr:glutaminase GtaA [Pyricularia oryzae 70-15]EHA51618.1 glutaminase GtaA [Pyricularia oryzae 70-15]